MLRSGLYFCFAAVLVLALAGRAEAACESQYRIPEENSQCLEESHGRGWYRAYNKCAHVIRVKVDVANGSDVDRDVPAAGGQFGKVEGDIDTSWGRYIRSVTCCSDYSSCN